MKSAVLAHPLRGQSRVIDWEVALPWMIALITMLLWSSAFAGIRVGLRSYAPESLALLRYLVASGVLGIYAIYTRIPLPHLRDVPAIAAIGFLGFTLYNIALNAGQTQINAGTASFIIASAPIFMALLTYLVYGERFNRWGWLGIAISFGGVSIISWFKTGGFQLHWAAVLVVVAALAQALYSVGQRNLLKRYPFYHFVVYAIWAGTFFLLPFSLQLYDDLQTASRESTLAIIYMGIFPSAIGYACWTFVLSRLSASIAGSFLYLVPILATLIAWFWLGEIPHPYALLGGGLIVVGVMTVNLRGRSFGKT